ncbi:hypothetical protein [Sphingopyxis sp.]|uniref:hypothetical protein n=1 Tax=Sphingopyxis sp. TaxID=1908224 RepID=UPI0025E4EAB3|nr:hypothetical protein [Sphingopyxis sp.]
MPRSYPIVREPSAAIATQAGVNVPAWTVNGQNAIARGAANVIRLTANVAVDNLNIRSSVSRKVRELG